MYEGKKGRQILRKSKGLLVEEGGTDKKEWHRVCLKLWSLQEPVLLIFPCLFPFASFLFEIRNRRYLEEN